MTPQQLAILKADILADPTLNTIPHTADGFVTIAAAYGVVAAPNFFVYRTNINPQEIFDQITWANFTPADAPDATVLWSNRSLSAQGKQFNLQTMLVGATSISAARANVRAGLQDALTNLQTGVGGALVSAGWVSVRDTVLARFAWRGEKLFATTTVQQDGSTAAKAATMTQEGAVSAVNVEAALAS